MYRTRLSWEEKIENVSGLVLATGSSTSVKVSISYSTSVADVNGAPSLVNPETRNFDQNSFYTLKGYYINLSGKIYYIPQNMTVSRTSSGGTYTWKASTAKRIISVGRSVSSGPKEKNVVISSKITASSNNGDNLMLGSVCSSQLEISIRSIGSDFSAAKGSSFSVYKIAPDGSETKIGVYNVSDAKWTSEHIYKIIAHDNVSKLNRDITGWLRGLTGWPYALTEFYGMLCDEVGVSHTYSTWDGASSFMVNQFDVEDGTTGQQLMGSICEIMGDYCIAQPDGSLRADWYSRRYIRIHSKANQVSEGSDIDVYRYGGSLTYGDYNVKDVKFVQFREEDSEDAALWPDYGNVNNADLSNAYIITGNPIILTHPTYLTDNSSSNSVRTAFDKIADRFDFETYRPFSVAIPETTNVHVGDYVMVGDENDKVLFLAPITDMTWTGNRIKLECTAKVNRENLDDPENWSNTQLAKYSDRAAQKAAEKATGEVAAELSNLVIYKSCSDCNVATTPGFYYLSGSNCKNHPSGFYGAAYGVMLVEKRNGDIYQTVKYRGYIAVRYSIRDENDINNVSSWTPWEYVNPPMEAGVEYRTTERYQGNTVFTKLVDFGPLPNTTTKTVSCGVAGGNIISWSAVVFTGSGSAFSFPFIAANGSVYAVAYISSAGLITVAALGDTSDATAKFTLKYIKS